MKNKLVLLVLSWACAMQQVQAADPIVCGVSFGSGILCTVCLAFGLHWRKNKSICVRGTPVDIFELDVLEAPEEQGPNLQRTPPEALIMSISSPVVEGDNRSVVIEPSSRSSEHSSARGVGKVIKHAAP
jgi:hypothetical protein